MVHRYIINRRTLLGPNDQTVSATTTSWVSGETFNNITNTKVNNTVIFDQEIYNKTITIPLEIKFEPMDNSDLINEWIGSEEQKVINRITDGEKVKYLSGDKDLKIKFRFHNKTTNTYSSLYNDGGFDLPTEYKFNRFNKSYFRLYFYDGDDESTSNLLFTEEVPVTNNLEAVFPLRRLYWNREDELMFNTLNNRTIYMDARFFNAKTGQVQRFYNPPTNVSTPIDITTYSNQNNKGWRKSPINFINPNNMGGDFKFTPINGVGGTTTNLITLSEFILI